MCLAVTDVHVPQDPFLTPLVLFRFLLSLLASSLLSLLTAFPFQSILSTRRGEGGGHLLPPQARGSSAENFNEGP